MLLSDLGQNIRPQTVDLLVFNPPYVPSEQEELGRADIAAAWAGGLNGRVVIDRFLSLVPVMDNGTD